MKLIYKNCHTFDFSDLFLSCPHCVDLTDQEHFSLPISNNTLFKHLYGNSVTAWYSTHLSIKRAAYYMLKFFVNVGRESFGIIDISPRNLCSYGTEPWCSA